MVVHMRSGTKRKKKRNALLESLAPMGAFADRMFSESAMIWNLKHLLWKRGHRDATGERKLPRAACNRDQDPGGKKGRRS